MLESTVERRLRQLEQYGFKVLKLKTPGYNGTKDRLILRPKYSPGPPSVVELKQPDKTERPLQAAVRDDWRERGVIVHDMCDTVEKVNMLISQLLYMTGWVHLGRWTHPKQFANLSPAEEADQS